MILPDVNVLLYAFRSDSAAHPAYRSWLEKIINSDEAYGISPKVLCSVVRESTHQGIHVRPSRLDDALAFARVMLGQATCNVIEPGDRHWSIFEDLSRRVPAAGNLVRDAWFAAPAIELGCEWITTDRDYARFPGLRWRPPFEGHPLSSRRSEGMTRPSERAGRAAAPVVANVSARGIVAH